MSESLKPPDKKTMVGTRGGTVLLRAWMVAAGTK